MGAIEVLYFVAVVAYLAQRITRGSRFSMFLVLLATLIHALSSFGLRGFLFVLVVGAISTIAELISLKSQFNVFGVRYRYNLDFPWFPSRLVIGGVLPVEVSAAWTSLKYITFFLGNYLAFKLGVPSEIKVVLSALMVVSIDLVLDPIAVEEGAWTWERGSWFFEIPFQNFLGWFLVGLASSALLVRLRPIGEIPEIMVLPILAALFTFLLGMGKRLLERDRAKGAIAIAPLTIFILLGAVSLFV